MPCANLCLSEQVSRYNLFHLSEGVVEVHQAANLDIERCAGVGWLDGHKDLGPNVVADCFIGCISGVQKLLLCCQLHQELISLSAQCTDH